MIAKNEIAVDMRKVLDAVRTAISASGEDDDDVMAAAVMAQIAGAVAARNGVLRSRVIAAVDAGAKHAIIEGALAQSGLGGPADSKPAESKPDWLTRKTK